MKSVDDKWVEVKSFYESAYRVKFKTRIEDKEINELYSKMRLLSQELCELPDSNRDKVIDIKKYLKVK